MAQNTQTVTCNEEDNEEWNRDDTGGNVICPLDRTARRTTDRTARRTTREEEGGEEDEDELTGRTKVGKIVGEVITRAK